MIPKSNIYVVLIFILLNYFSFGQEVCDNGIDDDGNGLTDCEDAACSPFVNNIQNGDFELTKPGCNTGFANFNSEALFWDNAAGTAEFYMDSPTCSFTARDFLGSLGAVNLLASSGFNYAGYHGLSTSDPVTIIQEVTIQELANPLENNTEYTLTYDVAQLIVSPSLGWEGDDEGVFKVFGIETGINKSTIDYTNCTTIENSNGIALLGESELITDSLTWHTQSNTFLASAQYDRILFAVCGHIYMGLDDVRINRATIIGTEPICAGDTTTVRISNLNKKITWSVDGAASFEIMGALNDSIKIVATNVDLDVYIGVEGFMCDSLVTIPVFKKPVVSISDEVTICANEEVDIEISGGTTYNWFNNTTGLNTTVGNIVTFKSDTTLIGENTFDVLVANEIACVDTASVTVNVLPLPVVNAFASDEVLCPTDLLTLTSNGTALSYSWNDGVLEGIPFQPGETNTYIVTGVATNGCSNTDDIMVEVINNFNPSIDIINDGPNCDDKNIIFSVNETAFLTPTPNFTWFQEDGITDKELGTGTTLIYSDPTNLNNIYVLSDSGKVCLFAPTTQVVSNSLAPEFIGYPDLLIDPDLDLCLGDSSILNVQDNNNVADEFKWFKLVADSAILINNTQEIQIINLNDNGQYFVEASNNFCTSSSDTSRVNIVDVFLNAFVSCPYVFENDEVKLSSSSNISVINWSSDIDGFLNQDLSFKTQVKETTVYKLTGEEKGCVLEDSVSVIVLKPYTIPQFFSPNNDDDNDTWIIDDLDVYPVFTLEVINEWGNEVAFWSNSYSPWNGKGKTGNPLPDGTYFYIIKITHKNMKLTPVTGYVTIIR